MRFNPNLYRNGKVCLSILGTWSGPSWTPVNSLMNEEPYRNEPGLETTELTATVTAYNDMIRHETLRMAVADMVASREAHPSMPADLRETVLMTFLPLVDSYVAACEGEADRLDGQTFSDPLGEHRGTFAFRALAERIGTLATRVEAGDLT